MTVTDPARQLAREIANLRREVAGISRGQGLAFSSLEVDGQTVTIPGTVRAVSIVQGVATVALDTANGKNAVTYSSSAASAATPGTREGDIWFQRANPTGGAIIGVWEWDGSEWITTSFGDEVLDSLTVGKLVSGEIAAGVRIIAGPASGTHAEMAWDGFRVFREDPVDGIPDEVARMGTQTNDYFAIVGADGSLKASIDDTGQGNFRSLNIAEDPTIKGRLFSQWIGDVPGGLVTTGSFVVSPDFASRVLPIGSEYGLAQHVFPVVAGRTYFITINGPTYDTGADGVEVILRARFATNGNASISSPEMWSDLNNGFPALAWQRRTLSFPFTANFTGDCYMLVSLQATGSTIAAFHEILFNIQDLGPYKTGTTTRNAGGGTLSGGTSSPPPAPATKQHFVELAPSSWGTYRGNGSQRTDTAGEICQGYDPSGFNGDGHGFMGFSLPSITGTVDWGELYLYSSHWYYNSGGTAILNLIKAGDPVNINALKLRSDVHIGGFPKPGGITIGLAPDWLAFFRDSSAPRALGFSLGKSGGTNLSFYGRFPVGAARLRLRYTQ